MNAAHVSRFRTLVMLAGAAFALLISDTAAPDEKQQGALCPFQRTPGP